MTHFYVNGKIVGQTAVFEIDGRVAAATPFNAAFVESVKQIPGRRWDASRRFWTVGKEHEPALRALVDSFFGAEANAPPAPAAPKEAPKNIDDFDTVEDYAWYFEGVVMKHVASMRSTAYMTLSLEKVRADGTVICPFGSDEDDGEEPIRVQGRVGRREFLGVYISSLEKGDVAAMVLEKLGMEPMN